MSDLHADKDAINTFLSAVFRYATEGTYVSLRGFSQSRRDVPPLLIRPIKVNGSLQAMLDAAVSAAEDCAQSVDPSVFAPPICTFSNPHHAALNDLADGVTLSVDIDKVDPEVARKKLEGILGPATVVVRSGSDWIDAITGEIKANLHLHWRLSEPTTAPTEHEILRRARTIAATLIGADPSGSSLVHPLRWPGSWHRKSTPRMATATYTEAEINLTDALDALEGAMEAEGRHRAEMPASGTPEAPIKDVASAMAAIPNAGTDVEYASWVRMGYAIYRATGGIRAGFDLWNAWSQKSEKYTAAETEITWRRIANATAGNAPPRTVGAGTIFFQANAAGWVRPFPFSGNDSHHAGEGVDEDWFARQQGQTSDKKTKRRDILSLTELDELPPPEWLIEGLIPEKSMVFPFGPPKAGKTFIVLSMGLHIAAGLDWFGKAVKQGAVVYIAGEGVGGMSMRLRAMRAYHKIPATVPFWVIRRAVNFRSEQEVRDLAALVRETVGNIPIKLIVVDTLARAMPGADENSAQETGLVIHTMQWLIDELDCTVAPIHHQGKDAERGARGTSALRGAWDAALQITAVGRVVTLTVADMKEAEAGEVMRFDMIDQMVTASRTSLVPVLCADQSAETEPSKPHLTGHIGLLYRVVRDLMAGPDSAIIPPQSDVPSGARGVEIDRVRLMFDDRMAAESADARRKAFIRSVVALQERQIIGVKSPWIWLASGVQ